MLRPQVITAVALAVAACTSTNTTPDAGPSDAAPATCASPGEPTPGPKDTHCTASDGGTTVQATSMASCHPDATAPDGGGGCPYGDSMFGQESDDDDCKYHVKWTASPICEGSAGVKFTVTVTHKDDGSILTGANTIAEVFTTSPGYDAGVCDNASPHPSPSTDGVPMAESPPGTYTRNIVFDKAGQWTVRFHFHEECADVFPDSPHGHAAYLVTVP
jgi:hypothetical protein